MIVETNKKSGNQNDCRLKIMYNQTRLFVRPIHLSHANIALIALLGHIFASLEEVTGFCWELLHYR